MVGEGGREGSEGEGRHDVEGMTRSRLCWGGGLSRGNGNDAWSGGVGEGVGGFFPMKDFGCAWLEGCGGGRW